MGWWHYTRPGSRATDAGRVRRVRRRALRVVKVEPAGPERSAGYDASLGCPGAAPLFPGAPAIRRNSVTEAQLHRAVARARCRVQCHRAFQDYRWQGRAMQIKRLTAGALALLYNANEPYLSTRGCLHSGTAQTKSCMSAPAPSRRSAALALEQLTAEIRSELYLL